MHHHPKHILFFAQLNQAGPPDRPFAQVERSYCFSLYYLARLLLSLMVGLAAEVYHWQLYACCRFDDL